MSRAERTAQMVRQAQAVLGKMLEESEVGQQLLRGVGITPEMSRAIRQRLEAAKPTAIGDVVRESGGITMGSRSVPSMRDLGAAPVPEFPVPAGSPQIRRLQQLRRELGAPQGPRESTSADFNFQPAITGMRNPAGMEAPGTMFSSTGRVTEPGTKIGGRMMAGEYPSSPRRTVIRETEVEVSPGQMQMNIAPGKVRMKQRPQEGPMLDTDMPPFRAPELPVVDEMRPRGVQLIDFGKLSKQLASASPAEKAGILAGLGLGTIGVGAMIRRPEQNNPAPEPLVPPTVAPLGETPENLSGATEGELPSTGLQGEAMAPAGVIPTNPPVTTTPAPDLTPEEAAAIAENTSRVVTAMQQADPASSSAVRAIAPRDPSSYRNIDEYYADQRRFVEAMDQGRMKDIVNAIGASQRDEVVAKNMMTWAQEHPVLAYQLANREGMVNPAQNQQSGQQLTTSTVGSSMGDNNEASAVGQANAAASQVNTIEASSELEAANLRQRNNELIEANRPLVRPQLTRAQEFLLRRTGRL